MTGGSRSSHLRHRPLRRSLAPAALVTALLLVIAGAVQAALPPKGASFSFHDHETPGKNWHVELQIDSKDPKKVKSLVVYSQQCKGTVAKAGVPISDAGVIAADGGLSGGGTWAIHATVKKSTTIVGAMRMTRADCDTGVLSFPNAITGDGHTDHEHGGGGHHGRRYPDFERASPRERRQARALQRRVLTTWRGVDSTEAERMGFFRLAEFRSKKRLGVFHVYNQRYEKDGRIFDARRPESLVFWRRPRGRPVILGMMFRVPLARPSFAGPIPTYHTHRRNGKKADNQMTHVWMVKDNKSAWASCMPVKQLEQYNPAFRFKPGRAGIEHVGVC